MYFGCSLDGNNDEELLMTVIQDKHRMRQKHLRHLQRHLAPPELHLWEKEEEDEGRESKHGMTMLRQLSLGTSLSSCTLTDCGSPQMCSEEDTEDNISESVSPETHSRATARWIFSFIFYNSLIIEYIFKDLWVYIVRVSMLLFPFFCQFFKICWKLELLFILIYYWCHWK